MESKHSGTDQQHNRQKCKQKCYVLIKILVIVLLVGFFIAFTSKINQSLSWIEHHVSRQFGRNGVPVFMLAVFSMWMAITPNGAAPTIVSGVLFQDRPWIGLLIAYLSTLFGSVLNLLWIRGLVLRYEDSKCVAFALKYLGINKFRKMEFVGKLFKIWHAIKIIVILRFPYFNSGMMNYLFSLQNEKINATQYIIGSAIGFVPGCIIFYKFGYQTKQLFSRIFADREQISSSLQQNKVHVIVFCATVVVMIIVYCCLFAYVRAVIRKIDEAEQTNEMTLIQIEAQRTPTVTTNDSDGGSVN